MAVNLSPIWGAGAQLLDNSGNVLSGGKIYTYAAGTTTQVTTYTSATGNTANSNPIVLNSAGRVPYEIWLTDGQNYKFVLKDSNDVLIGTWDNLSGINSNFIAYTNQQEIQTATAGQTVFNLTTMQYLPGTNSLSVFVDGVNQYGPGAQYAYVETDSDTVTFTSGLHDGAEVKFTSSQIQNAGVTDASQITYDPPFTNSVATNVEAKLAQTVSVKDFGAVGDGVTDDTQAIQDAIDALIVTDEYFFNGNVLVFPEGNYLISEALVINGSLSIVTSGKAQISGSLASATKKAAFYIGDVSYIGTNNGWFKVGVKGLYFNVTNHQYCVQVQGIRTVKFEDCVFTAGSLASFVAEGAWAASYVRNCQFWNGSAKAIELLDNSNGFLIENNRIGNYSTVNGLAIYVRACQGVWIQNNDFEYNYAQITFYGTSVNQCNNIHIENNWIEGATGHSIRIDNQTYGSRGVTIRGNSVYGTPDGGVYLGVSGGLGEIVGAIVDGNGFYSPAAFYQSSISTKYVDVSVKNNYPDASNVKCPAFRAVKTVTQTIPSASYTKLTWSAEQFDRGGFFSGNLWNPTSSRDILVQVKASIAFLSGITAGDYLAVAIYKNGSLLRVGAESAQSATSGTIAVDVIDICNGTSDYYEVYAYAQNGGEITASAATVWFEGMVLDF